jgi:hypothetical protein
MFMTASTQCFLEKMVFGRGRLDLQPILRLVKYYSTQDVIEDLLTQQTTQEEQSMLSYFLSDGVVESCDPATIKCNLNGPLNDVPEWLLKIAVAADNNLVSENKIAPKDAVTFRANDIKVVCGEEAIAKWLYEKIRGERVINSWTLHDGGTTRPSAILGSKVLTASSISVYDKYFNEKAVFAFDELFKWAYGRRGTLAIDVKIYAYFNDAKKSLTPADTEALRVEREKELRAALGHYFSSTGKIRIYEVSSQINAPVPHDRFFQVDDRFTFLFTAGCDCFYAGNGNLKNRACSVFLTSVAENAVSIPFNYIDGSKTAVQTILI